MMDHRRVTQQCGPLMERPKIRSNLRRSAPTMAIPIRTDLLRLMADFSCDYLTVCTATSGGVPTEQLREPLDLIRRTTR